jgi:hypothetical protein
MKFSRSGSCLCSTSPRQKPQNIPPFLLIKEGETFTNLVNWSVVRNFLSYYVHHFGGKSITQNQWKKALDALQDWVNSNLLGLGYSPAQNGLVRANNVVQSISSSINSGKAKLKEDMNTDIQVDLLRRRGPAQTVRYPSLWSVRFPLNRTKKKIKNHKITLF